MADTPRGLFLIQAVEALSMHGEGRCGPRDPLGMILWTNMGGLIDDQRRWAIFEGFKGLTGLDPARILAADDAALAPLAKRGGMKPELRIERWRGIARLVLERCDGDLDSKLRSLPLPKARALLKAFPVIGDPGADKIVLLCGLAPRPAIDTNGLRALVRLGFFPEGRSWAASYKAGIELLASDGRTDAAWLALAFGRLREHGKTLCRRSRPLCDACPLDAVCVHAPATQF